MYWTTAASSSESTVKALAGMKKHAPLLSSLTTFIFQPLKSQSKTSNCKNKWANTPKKAFHSSIRNPTTSFSSLASTSQPKQQDKGWTELRRKALQETPAFLEHQGAATTTMLIPDQNPRLYTPLCTALTARGSAAIMTHKGRGAKEGWSLAVSEQTAH